MIIHIIPNNDLIEHEQDSTCHCSPTATIQDGGDIILIHNSYDHRECIEQVMDILNKKGL